MRTKIILASSGVVDMFEDAPLSLNYSVADIKDVEKRNASFSKTIRLPGNPNNNKLFGHIFEIDIYSNFNPTIKAECTLMVDDMPNLTGYLQLTNIVRDRDKIEYEVTIVGNVGNLYLSIGERLLTDLDLSAYDHTYNATNQQASWTAPIGVGYMYPIIDYGHTNGVRYEVDNLFPAIYAKTYVDKIFTQAGISYTSPFFGSDYFKRMVHPFVSGTLAYTDAQITARLFSASSTGTQTISSSSGVVTMLFNNEVTDPSSQYNPTTSIFTNANAGTYTFSVSLLLTVFVAANGSEFQVSIFKVLPNGNRQRIGGDRYGYAPGGSGDYTVTATSLPTYFNVGERCEVRMDGRFGTTYVNSGSTFTNNVVNNGVRDGDTLLLNSAIPRNVKQKDYLKSLVSMFNLYIDIDKNNPNNYIIEPRNDFYSSGTTKDWSQKRDTSRELNIKPIANLNTKKYIYTYKEDKDFYNDLYQTHKSEVYGTKTINLNNDFITGETKIELMFSPTPLVKNGGDRLMSVISDVAINQNTGTSEEFNMRILYFGGVFSTNSPLRYNGLNQGTYPYTGHLDQPVTPTKDISFGVPKEVYFQTSQYTNNNLYNTYYKQFLEEITDKDSKTVTGYFYLNPVDIYLLDFRNIYIVDGHALRLNSITDYNPLANDVCKCEFIKIKDKDLFTASNPAFVGGINVIF